MKLITFFSVITCLLTSCNSELKQNHDGSVAAAPIALVIHGGAGTIKRESLTPEKERLYHKTLKQAIDSGYSVLEAGGTSIEAVVAVVVILENSPLFNAGKGAVFTNDGTNELDASIMDGKNLMAGAVAGVRTIKNPILAARAVMSKSPHVMLSGEGADAFAKDQALEIVPNNYFFDSARYRQFQIQVKKDAATDTKFGTVGCVALDQYGNLAAGTSTGGMTNKKYGRIGDAPIIGAGTYANNETCGVSSTGWGEYFIRLAVAHDISALMEYKGLSLEEAASRVVMEKVPALGGDGGVIGLTRSGDIVMVFNTAGMYRGYRKKGEQARTFIFGDD